MIFLEYPKCSTCRKAKAWLNANGLEYKDIDIVLNVPTVEELKGWHSLSKLPLKKFFNTSGVSYRELGLKDRLPNMTEEEMFELLASDGKLIKRPLVIKGDIVLVGFKEEEWKALL